MHELGLCAALLDSVLLVTAEEPVAGVTAEVGELHRVDGQSLAFGWRVATEGTPASGSRLRVEKVRARVHCGTCRAEFELGGGELSCPRCGGCPVTLLSGRELQVLEVQLASGTVLRNKKGGGDGASGEVLIQTGEEP